MMLLIILMKIKPLKNILKNFVKQEHKYQILFLTIEIRKRCLTCAYPAHFFEASPVINIYLKGVNDNVGYNKISLEKHLKTLLITEEEENINCFLSFKEIIRLLLWMV